eukprot:4364597-Pleurochrysis_carterae.AAC.2
MTRFRRGVPVVRRTTGTPFSRRVRAQNRSEEGAARCAKPVVLGAVPRLRPLVERDRRWMNALKPREGGLADEEVHFGCEDDFALGRHPDVVGPRRRRAAPEVGADPGAGLHAGLGVGLARLHCAGTTAEQ